MKNSIALFAFLICSMANAQGITRRALFLGNSYIQVNNLPQMIADMAVSTGDELIFDSNTPGGHTFQGHSTNTTSLSLIEQGNWDYVVLQEQSQRPAFPLTQVETEVFPFAQALDNIINTENTCAETVFYMTWGRKNGDTANCASWPPVCTYHGMDSLLNLRYRMMAEDNNAILSPVGEVWKHIRQNYPTLELYQADESHPSIAGTYAAACSFYATLFRKDPTLITFNSTLADADAEVIREAAKLVVFDSLLNWHIGEYDPSSDFAYNITEDQSVVFNNASTNATSYQWYFGDGATSTGENPTHSYGAIGSYDVTLIAEHCGLSSTTIQTIQITAIGITNLEKSQEILIYPNPAIGFIHINDGTRKGTSYKIMNNLGQEKQSGRLLQGESRIDVKFLPSGTHIIHIFEHEQMIGEQRFVKMD